MKTTNSIRGVVAELDQRGLAPADVDIFLPRCETRDEFVRVARAFAANEVGHGESHLWACRRDGVVEVTVFAGEWWQEVVAYLDAPTVFEAVRREILAVVADDEACAFGHDWEPLLEGDRAYDGVCTRCGLRQSQRSGVPA